MKFLPTLPAVSIKIPAVVAYHNITVMSYLIMQHRTKPSWQQTQPSFKLFLGGPPSVPPSQGRLGTTGPRAGSGVGLPPLGKPSEPPTADGQPPLSGVYIGGTSRIQSGVFTHGVECKRPLLYQWIHIVWNSLASRHVYQQRLLSRLVWKNKRYLRAFMMSCNVISFTSHPPLFLFRNEAPTKSILGASFSDGTQLQERAHSPTTWHQTPAITDCWLGILQAQETARTVQECLSQTHTVRHSDIQ